jgi:HK97 family phage major capsid protein
MKTKYNSLKELRGRQKAVSDTVGEALKQAGEDCDYSKVTALEGADTKAKVEKLHALTDELQDLHDDIKEMEAISKKRQLADEAAEYKGNFPREQPGDKLVKVKSLGELFTESKLYDGRQVIKHRDVILDIDVKTTMSRSAGWDPEALRIPRVELYPLRKLSVLDLYPQYDTVNDTVKYMKETTHTNNAAEAAEAAVYGEAAIALTETSDEVEKVGVWLPVTDEQLEDVAGLSQFINNRLTYMLKNRIDSQLMEGDGTTPNLWGAANLASVQTQAKSTDPTPDAFFKAMTKVRGTTAGTGFGEPSACVINPSDWEDIRLLRTADGIYIFGNPNDAGPERLWGVPAVVTSAKTAATGLVGDFTNFAGVFWKRGIQFKVTDSHASYFIYGVQAIRADVRLAAVYFRDSAFCTVTGI